MAKGTGRFDRGAGEGEEWGEGGLKGAGEIREGTGCGAGRRGAGEMDGGKWERTTDVHGEEGGEEEEEQFGHVVVPIVLLMTSAISLQPWKVAFTQQGSGTG